MDKSELALVRVSFALSATLMHSLVRNEVFTKPEAIAIIATARKSIQIDPAFCGDPIVSQLADKFLKAVELGVTSIPLQQS
jgi:hypothetical protein